MRVLVVNSGSSSLKLRLLEPAEQGRDTVIWRHDAPAPAELSDEELTGLLVQAPRADAVGHRVVHGGADFTGPTLVDDAVLDRLEALTALAPLHQPPALRLARTVIAAWPERPNVACFDTSFHRTVAPAAETYPIPEAWRKSYPIRRYGFHGLSHAWAARRVAGLTRGGCRRLVVCHLGAGASLSAVHDGRCVDTTMGFTPLEGLMMATRSGNVDPGLVLWLIRSVGLSPEQVEHGLVYESGLLGVAGQSDMRTVANLADAGDEAASLSLDMYLHRLRAGIAAMAAAIGGLDALAFTGGVGEHAWQVRARAADGLAFLGVRIDPVGNKEAQPDAELTGVGATVRSFLIEAREDLEIARATRKLLTA
ncbi:MAG TPA: acetate/propionate family kinase [Micromonosporaceae bacterium]|jgi:acetate kinase|nr:acetate/propionate family kinase [Micromonosporaceae bacterium]